MPYPFWKVFLILHRLSVGMDLADELNRSQKSPLCKAMGQLASGYRDGWDVPKDLDLATKWFERAADFTVEAMYQSYLMFSQEHCWRWSSGGVFSTSDWIRNILCWLVKGIGGIHVYWIPSKLTWKSVMSNVILQDTSQRPANLTRAKVFLERAARMGHEESMRKFVEPLAKAKRWEDWGWLGVLGSLAFSNPKSNLTNRGILAWSNSLRFEFPSKFSPETSKPTPLQVVCSSHLIQVRRWLGSPGSKNANQKCIHKS